MRHAVGNQLCYFAGDGQSYSVNTRSVSLGVRNSLAVYASNGCVQRIFIVVLLETIPQAY